MSGILLAILAHQDDEFAALPILADGLRRGERVVVVYGTRQHSAAQEATRERESCAVLTRLGVARTDVSFADGPGSAVDGAGYRGLANLFELLARRFHSERERVTRLLVPAWEGGHMDHDGVHAVGIALRSRNIFPNAEVWQFPIYTAGRFAPYRVMHARRENGPGERCRFGLRDGSTWLRQLLRYRSQWRSFVGLGPEASVRYLVIRHVVVQPGSATRVLERPHPEPLLYERRFGVSYSTVAEAIRSELMLPA